MSCVADNRDGCSPAGEKEEKGPAAEDGGSENCSNESAQGRTSAVAGEGVDGVHCRGVHGGDKRVTRKRSESKLHAKRRKEKREQERRAMAVVRSRYKGTISWRMPPWRRRGVRCPTGSLVLAVTRETAPPLSNRSLPDPHCISQA